MSHEPVSPCLHVSLQVLVDGTQTTLVLENLDPLTEYVVNVFAVVGEESSEPLKGTETTRKLSSTSLPMHHYSPFQEHYQSFPILFHLATSATWE